MIHIADNINTFRWKTRKTIRHKTIRSELRRQISSHTYQGVGPNQFLLLNNSQS